MRDEEQRLCTRREGGCVTRAAARATWDAVRSSDADGLTRGKEWGDRFHTTETDVGAEEREEREGAIIDGRCCRPNAHSTLTAAAAAA